jgi:hypothetical protein
MEIHPTEIRSIVLSGEPGREELQLHDAKLSSSASGGLELKRMSNATSHLARAVELHFV